MRRGFARAKQHTERIILDLLGADKTLFESHQRRALKEGFITSASLTHEQLQEQLRGGVSPTPVSPAEHLQVELAVFKSILDNVSSRRWTLLIAPPGGLEFITCDHPVTLVFKQVIFPLSARHAVMGDLDRHKSEPFVMDAAGVAEINSRMLDLADRQVYSKSLTIFYRKDGKVEKLDLRKSNP